MRAETPGLRRAETRPPGWLCLFYQISIYLSVYLARARQPQRFTGVQREQEAHQGPHVGRLWIDQGDVVAAGEQVGGLRGGVRAVSQRRGHKAEGGAQVGEGASGRDVLQRNLLLHVAPRGAQLASLHVDAAPLFEQAAEDAPAEPKESGLRCVAGGIRRASLLSACTRATGTIRPPPPRARTPSRGAPSGRA